MFGLFRQVASAWNRRATLRELRLLSDHHLADLGLRREQLATLEREPQHERKHRAEPRAAFRPELVPCG